MKEKYRKLLDQGMSPDQVGRIAAREADRKAFAAEAAAEARERR